MLELTIRLVVSLSIVVGLLLLLARFGARKFRASSGALVQVIHRQPLSRTTSVAVVSVGSRVLVLGTTEQQVSVLGELDPTELTDSLGPGADVIELARFESELVEVPLLPAAPARPAHRGSHRAPAPAPTGRLAGSVLSVQTWRQALAAVTSATSRRAS